MDSWKYYDITHRDHVVCNPTSLAKLDELIGLLDLPAEPRILEIAAGKGELLTRIVERYGRAGGTGVSGVAIDLSPYCVPELREKLAERVPEAAIEVLEMDGAAYRAEPASFDLVSFWDVLEHLPDPLAALRAARRLLRPGGRVVVETQDVASPLSRLLGRRWHHFKHAEHLMHFQYLYMGIGDNNVLVPWMWTSAILSVIALVLLINPGTRKNEKMLVFACIAVFIALWIEKGLGLVVTGFIPNPLGLVREYWPTLPEAMIALGVYGIGLLIITVLYKIALSVRGEVST